MRKRSSYTKTGECKGTAQICATAQRLMSKGMSQNKAAAAVGMSSSGLKKAIGKHGALKKRRSRSKPTEQRGRWTKMSHKQKLNVLTQFFLLQSQGLQPTAPFLWRKCNLVKACHHKTVGELIKQADQIWRRRKTKSQMCEGDAEERKAWARDMLKKLREDPHFFWRTDAWTDCFSVSMPMCEAPIRTTMAYLPLSGDECLAPWATRPGDHRYKGWNCHFFYGFGPDRSKRKKRGKLLFLERYKGGGKKNGGWCKEEAIRLIRKGWLDKAIRKNPRRRFSVQTDRDGAFTSPWFKRELAKLRAQCWETKSRASDVAPIEKAIGFGKRLIGLKANSMKKWRNGVKDTPKNREAWAKLCETCMRSITKQPKCRDYYTNLINGMSKVPAKILKAKGNRIRG